VGGSVKLFFSISVAAFLWRFCWVNCCSVYDSVRCCEDTGTVTGNATHVYATFFVHILQCMSKFLLLFYLVWFGTYWKSSHKFTFQPWTIKPSELQPQNYWADHFSLSVGSVSASGSQGCRMSSVSLHELTHYKNKQSRANFIFLGFFFWQNNCYKWMKIC
jgi:hypothetical protein